MQASHFFDVPAPVYLMLGVFNLGPQHLACNYDGNTHYPNRYIGTATATAGAMRSGMAPASSSNSGHRSRAPGERYFGNGPIGVSKSMTRAKLEVLFDRPVEQAARALGVSSTIIKRLCRRHGIPKWPYRQLLRIDGHISKREAALATMREQLHQQRCNGSEEGGMQSTEAAIAACTACLSVLRAERASVVAGTHQDSGSPCCHSAASSPDRQGALTPCSTASSSGGGGGGGDASGGFSSSPARSSCSTPFSDADEQPRHDADAMAPWFPSWHRAAPPGAAAAMRADAAAGYRDGGGAVMARAGAAAAWGPAAASVHAGGGAQQQLLPASLSHQLALQAASGAAFDACGGASALPYMSRCGSGGGGGCDAELAADADARGAPSPPPAHLAYAYMLAMAHGLGMAPATAAAFAANAAGGGGAVPSLPPQRGHVGVPHHVAHCQCATCCFSDLNVGCGGISIGGGGGRAGDMYCVQQQQQQLL